MGKNSSGKWAAGALAAGAAGYLAGILTAPKSGKETREDIRRAALKAKTEAEKKLKASHSELVSLLDQAMAKQAELKGKAKEDFDKAVDGAATAKDKVREILSTMHEGGVEDPELQAALVQARSAIDHLKTYFKK